MKLPDAPPSKAIDHVRSWFYGEFASGRIGGSVRKLLMGVRYTLEAAQDVMAAIGICVEAELTEALIAEMMLELRHDQYVRSAMSRDPIYMPFVEIRHQFQHIRNMANDFGKGSRITAGPDLMFFLRHSKLFSDDELIEYDHAHPDTIVITAPDWLRWYGDEIVVPGSVVLDPMTFEPVLNFYTDVTPIVKEGAVKVIKTKILNIADYSSK